MKTKEGFMLRNVAGKDIVVAVGTALMDFNGLISLNETGAFLWKELEKGTDYDALLSKLLDEYDIDEATAKDGLDKFLESARAAGLVEE
ncbi:MAG: PqqD family protein [Eubacteriales bacterium]|nr:PqqD family protein [Eubacteriales bacterium]